MASIFALAVNDFRSSLASAHAAGASTLVLQPGAGARLGALPANRVYRVTAVQAPDTVSELILGVFEATGLATDTLTGVTGAEGFANVALAVGVTIDVRMTDKDLAEVQDAVNVLEATTLTALTGDVTASGPGTAVATLASTAVTPGSYTSADITVDAKGRITAAASGTGGTGGGAPGGTGTQLQYRSGPSTFGGIPGSSVSQGAVTFTNATVPGTPGTASTINTGDPSTKGLVIRGNLFTPAGSSPDTIAGLQLWLKADSLALSDGDPVTTWADSSAAGNNVLSNGTTPILKASILGGKPVVRFGGAGSFTRSSVSMTGATGYSFFAVAKLATTASYPMLLVFPEGQNELRYNDVTDHPEFACNTSNSVVSPIGAGTSTFRMIEGWFEASTGTVRLFMDGTIRGTSSGSTTITTSGNLWVGSRGGTSFLFTGDLAEAIIYDVPLSDAHRIGVETYLAAKYGLTLAGQQISQSASLLQLQLPDGTPYCDGDGTGNVSLGLGALATTASDGFPYLSSGAGPPTGTPTAKSGFVPLYYDTTNNYLYLYNGGWKKTTQFA